MLLVLLSRLLCSFAAEVEARWVVVVVFFVAAVLLVISILAIFVAVTRSFIVGRRGRRVIFVRHGGAVSISDTLWGWERSRVRAVSLAVSKMWLRRVGSKARERLNYGAKGHAVPIQRFLTRSSSGIGWGESDASIKNVDVVMVVLVKFGAE